MVYGGANQTRFMKGTYLFLVQTVTIIFHFLIQGQQLSIRSKFSSRANHILSAQNTVIRNEILLFRQARIRL